MRKSSAIFLPFLALLLTLGSCVDYVDGVGEPVTDEFFLNNFSRFVVDGNFEVLLSQGPRQRVFITAQPDILDVINTRVRRGVWEIGYITNSRPAIKPVIEIILPDIREIVIDGSGDVIAQNYLQLDHIDILIDGSGDIELFGETNTQYIEIDGSGDVHNFDLLSYETNIFVDGSGDCEVTAEDVLDVRIDASGDVFFKGFPDLFLEINGSGEVVDYN